MPDPWSGWRSRPRDQAARTAERCRGGVVPLLLFVSLGVAMTALAGASWSLGHRMVAADGGAITDQAPPPGGSVVRAAAVPGQDGHAAGSRGRLFGDPVFLQHSAMDAEPGILLDRVTDRVYVSGTLGVVGFAASAPAPIWVSVDGARTFGDAVATYQPDNTGTLPTVVGGADSDLVAIRSGALYQVDAWANQSGQTPAQTGSADASMGVSGDGGVSWAGIPLSAVGPEVERPWLAYDPTGDTLYMTWTAAGAIHLGKAVLRQAVDPSKTTPASLAWIQDTPVTCSVPVTQTTGNQTVDTACQEGGGPPGSITVDPAGHVWIAFARQNGSALGGGVGIAESTDGGITWTVTSVPDSGAAGDPLSVSYDFQVVRSDSAGNMYVVWSQAPVGSAPAVYYSWLPRGQTQWHEPVRVSVPPTAVLGQLAVVRPGVIDIAYYGTDYCCDRPINVPDAESWGVYLAQSTDALHGGPFTTAVALPRFHTGKLCTGPDTCGNGAGIGDHFGLAVDEHGLAIIATKVDDTAQNGLVGIAVTRQLRPLPAAPRVAPDGSAAVLSVLPYDGPSSGGGAAPSPPPLPLPVAIGARMPVDRAPARGGTPSQATGQPRAAVRHAPVSRLAEASLPAEDRLASDRTAVAVGVLFFLTLIGGALFARARQ